MSGILKYQEEDFFVTPNIVRTLSKPHIQILIKT
jgi:hypothetical protein